MKPDKSTSLTSHFVFGANNFSENPDLKLDEQGGGVLHRMHTYVVPGLAELVNGKNLAQRWQDREQQLGCDYFAFYQKNEAGQVISILTGVINKDNTMQILNTATDPDFRRQGLMENCFYSLVTHPEFPANVKRIDGSLNTGINKTPRSDLTEEEKKSYENEQRGILAEINQSLGESGLDAVTGGSLDEEKTKSQLSEKAQEVLNEIKRSVLWQKVNFAMMQKVFAELPEKNFEFVLGEPSRNINLSPSSIVNEQLKNYCAEKLARRQRIDLDLESDKEGKKKDSEELKSTSPQPNSASQLQKQGVQLGSQGI